MNELELKYGCNPNQKPSRIFMRDGGDLPITVLNGRPGYINFLDALNSWQLVRELSLLGLDEEVLERTFSTLSGGEQTRVLLSALFLDEGSWPMLDEPTDHLDEEGRELLAQYLSHSRRGFLLVSHDRAFLDRCVDHVLALNRTGPELVKGNFSVWYQEKQDRDRREQAQNQQLKGEIRRLEQAARRTSAWSDQVEKTKYALSLIHI